MISTILVPLDGSALAEAALPVAEAVAALAGAGVTFMQVAATSGPLRGLSEDEVEVRLGWKYEAAAERDARSYLAAVAQRFAARQIVAHTRVAAGPPAEQIIRAGAAADLIIMATHGRSGAGRWAFGSVADAVLRAAPAPVLLVRAGRARAVDAGWPRCVLVPLDGSDLAARALPLAACLARRAGAALVLLRSIAELEEIGGVDASLRLTGMAAGSLRERAEARARDALRQAAEPLARAGLAVELDLRREPAAEAILAGAAEQGADLIVMSTHGRGGLGRWAHGSVADRVMRAAAAPVLLVRDGTTATAVPQLAAGEMAG